MKWTKEKPTVPGWYWMFRKGDTISRIEYVRKYGGMMCILNWEITDKAKWAGPIPEPEED